MMNYVSDVKDAIFFKQSSIQSKKRALVNLKQISFMMVMPYSDFESNMQGFKHPFCHATQLVRNAARLMYGVGVLAGSLATFNINSSKNALSGLYALTCAIGLELLNTSLALISLATRTITTLFNLSYSATATQQQSWDDEKTHRIAYSFI